MVISCKDDVVIKSYNISGKAQKGPLLKGSVVVLNELGDDLGQTGKSFTTDIANDNGFFELYNVQLQSPFSLLTATGFYFNEVYGELSPAQITLQAYADLTDKEKINVNILTHLTKQRIEKLMDEGMDFADAKLQAETEFLSFMGQSSAIDKAFEDLDISVQEDANAILLAFSVISQRYSQVWGQDALSTAELSELLTKISDDFKDDGMIDTQSIIDTLMYNISMISLADVRVNVENRYAVEDSQIVIPDFEKYVTSFQQNHSKTIYNDFEFPEVASPDPVMSPNSVIDNILVKCITGKLECIPYSLAAIVPFDHQLMIRIVNKTGNGIMRGGPNFGWEQIWEQGTSVFTYKSQRNNMLISALVYLEGTGTASLEIYEDDFNNPSMVYNVEW